MPLPAACGGQEAPDLQWPDGYNKIHRRAQRMKMKRVFLKLSGEALAGPKKTGFDEDTVKEVARQVKLSVDAGVQVGIVIGGGTFWRGRTSDAIDRTNSYELYLRI